MEREEKVEDLIKKAQAHDDAAMETLLKMFKPKVIAISREYFLIGADVDDLIQEGMIGLFRAIRIYNPEKNHNFNAFASLCIHRQLQNAVKNANRKKNTPLNAYIPINNADDTRNADGDDEPISIIIADEESNIEKYIIDREVNAIVLSKVKDMFNYLQNRVLKMFLNGDTYQDIASACSLTPKKVDNMLQSIKKKLKTIKGDVE